MTKVLWYLSPYDGRQPWSPAGRYPIEQGVSRLRTLAETIDRSRFYGALQGTYTQDTLISIASISQFTQRMRFLIPFYPGLTSPRLLAQQISTLDLYTQGRVLINVVNGQDDRLAQFGLPVPKEQRYELSSEFWSLFTGFYRGEEPSYAGTYLSRERFAKAFDHAFEPVPQYLPSEVRALSNDPITPIQLPNVPLWGAGESDPGIEFVGRNIETYLVFHRDLTAVKSQVDAAVASAKRHGRTFDGVGLHGSLTVRPTTREAVDYFYHQIEATGWEALAEREDRGIRTLTKGQRDLKTFEPRDRAQRGWVKALAQDRLPELEDLKVGPSTYLGPAAFNTSTFIVGSGDEVAAEIARIQTLIPEVDRFIFSGWPLLQEGEYVNDYLLERIPDLEY